MTPTEHIEKALAAVVLIQAAHRPLKDLCAGATTQKGKNFARHRFVYSAVEDALRDAHRAFFKQPLYWTEAGRAAEGRERVYEHCLPLVELAEQWFRMDDLSAATIVRCGVLMPLAWLSAAENAALHAPAGNGQSLYTSNPWPEAPFTRYAKASLPPLHTAAGPLPSGGAFTYDDHIAYVRGQSDSIRGVLDHFGL